MSLPRLDNPSTGDNPAAIGPTTIHDFNIPASAAHEPDLSKLSPDELRKHHVRTMREIRFNGSPADIRAYQERHPETAGYKARSTVTVEAPKPAGYEAALLRMTGAWLDSQEALRRTNQADVEALNATFGGQRYNPANFLNRDISAGLRKRIAEQFKQPGHLLPDAAHTLAKVKKAAKAAQAGTLPDATAFGILGTLAGAVLTIGDKAFRIREQHGHQSVRFYHSGKEAQLRLDLLTEFLDQCGLLRGGEPCSPLFSSREEEGETVAKLVPAEILPGETGADIAAAPARLTKAESLPVETVANPDQPPPSLAERIAALATATCREPPADQPPGIDPLEFA